MSINLPISFRMTREYALLHSELETRKSNPFDAVFPYAQRPFISRLPPENIKIKPLVK